MESDRRTGSIISLNQRFSDESDSELGEFIEDKTVPAVFDEVHVSLRKANLQKVLDRLPYREKRVLEMRYLDEPRKTLDQVGRSFNVTRERARQLESIALARLYSDDEASWLLR